MLRNWFSHLFKKTTSSPLNTLSTNEGQVAISLAALLKLRYAADTINLSLQRKTSRQITGGFTSGFRGRGVDFAEVRDYQIGDDVNRIDWRVTARTGKPHTKLYEEEKECPIFIVVDYSPSMFFGSRKCFKSVVAATAAALLAWSALKNRDRVGGLIFSGQQHQELPPRASLRGVLPLLKALADTETPQQMENTEDSMVHTLRRLRHLTRPGSRIFLLSDFKNLNEEAVRHLHRLSQHNEIIAGFIYDPLEKNLPPPNTYNVTDGEHQLLINTQDKKLRAHYQQQFFDHYNKVQKSLRACKIRLIPLATNENITKSLEQGLTQARSLEMIDE